jgi:adenine-specific DNA-methyltransferase
MNNFEKAFEEVQLLVQKFENGIEKYMSPNYSEAEARQHFIDNFFIALGWNVRSDGQHNPYEQEVKIELSQKQQNESSRKRADYAFYKAPNFKDVHFFVEAKKPAVLIQNNPIHYFQTIKYGWNATCPISVLTDFEELVIVDCRHKPDIRYALNGAHQKFRYTDYTNKEKFASIYYLLSKEAVHNNSIENYVSQLPKAKGKATQKTLFPGAYKEIDDDFLNYIDGIRENLAKAFKKNDETLDSEALTEATQRTVDRLVFIRFLEDKLIEPHNHISEYGIQGKSVWKDFIADCRALDAKYNGVVFKKHFIDDQDFVGAEDKAFADICADISNVNSPYHFNYIPIHILGSIYERFLGKVVIATDKRVRIEEKPEVRKAGGVYYTPKYIVDYIVENTIGKLIANKKPSEIADMHFADIACGSGSFLIGVYDCLLKYHNDYYQTNTAQAKKDACEFRDGQYVLSLKQKQDILLNNIYGVDIDAQAVEVTQLSLFLKMLEDENVSTTQKQSSLFLKVLPDLTGNIKCGNSLIGTDILDGQLFNFDEEKALNPFDYTTAFAKVMKKGGFDAIVGNPPYVKVTEKSSLSYFQKNYKNQNYQLDLYLLFLEKYNEVLKEKSSFGVIIPNTWLQSLTYKNIRIYLVNNFTWEKILISKKYIFDAIVDTHVLIFNKEKKTDTNVEIEIVENEIISKYHTLKQSDFAKDGSAINIIANSNQNLLKKTIIEKSITVKEISKVYSGITVYEKGKGIPIQTAELIKSNPYVKTDVEFDSNNQWLPLMRGSLMNRYINLWNNNYWVLYGNNLGAPRNPIIFKAKEKIIVRQTGDRIIATIIKENIICRKNLHILISENYNHRFILGILNSKLINFYYQQMNPEKGEALAEVKKMHVEQLPIPNLDLSKTEDKAKHDKLVQLVEQMLQSKQQLQTEKIEKNKNYLEQKCTNLDKQIDTLVYELYNLTEDEIKIIENSN